jgi:pilus assembly protein CpaF
MTDAFGRRSTDVIAPSGERSGIRDLVREQVLARVDPSVAVRMDFSDLRASIDKLIGTIADERHLLLNQDEQHALATELADDMVGLGPVEPLLHDDSVSDILINGPRQIYVERRGKLELTTAQFRSDAHVLHIAHRIASSIGRRIDESSPMLDARLHDGSRVNCITSPLSLKGTCISIRKFARQLFDFDSLLEYRSVSPSLARALQIAARCRLNLVISGGTGSGKTTLLNAMSQLIDPGERIVTIEDTAELQLQQPHVLPLETRPPNIEGYGQITQRELVRNALRMRPDRIIVGEVRGAEAFDMLQAMNTGHNGSMSTVHANSSRDALSRIENMVFMANVNLPSRAVRGQVASALDLVIQIERMRDGVRRVTEVTEVVGIDEGQIATRALFAYHYIGENPDGTLRGTMKSTGAEPHFLSRLEYYGAKEALLQAVHSASEAM